MKIVVVFAFAVLPLLVASAAQSTTETETGARIYAASGCAGCHSNGVGPALQGLYGRTELTDHGPVLADDVYVRESIVTPGAKIVSGYSNIMPPYGDQLSNEDLKELAAYVETLGH